MTDIGANGIYLCYRLHPDEQGKTTSRLVGRFALAAGVIHIMEDYDGVLKSSFPDGPLNGRLLRRMQNMALSPYWRIVPETDAAHHEDLVEELNPAPQPWQPPQE